MKTVLLGLIGPAAIGLVMLGCVVGTRIAPRFRDPRSLIVVVDRRTCREAIARIPRLIAAGDSRDLTVAYHGIIAMLLWLEGEAKHGRQSRRPWCRRQIDDWTLRRAELADRLGLDWQAVL